eukprot:CAMPEP_0179332466 /NCGR_PEP_ID=MMETSP0797-20121207/64749_1 /TAXON_ID=47934 /ORGANISM="Dinophysis acuminata, Strain DAEP01" /LENGTH=123 /DNA_ID=CAMNT_0021045337 /DNA_START=149 /DNA_END=517 /DNA_ORIENTATION=-
MLNESMLSRAPPPETNKVKLNGQSYESGSDTARVRDSLDKQPCDDHARSPPSFTSGGQGTHCQKETLTSAPESSKRGAPAQGQPGKPSISRIDISEWPDEDIAANIAKAFGDDETPVVSREEW